jgi:hypothetical protein
MPGLKDWGSLLKVQTIAKNQKAVAKRVYLDELEGLLQEEKIKIGDLHTKA